MYYLNIALIIYLIQTLRPLQLYNLDLHILESMQGIVLYFNNENMQKVFLFYHFIIINYHIPVHREFKYFILSTYNF